MGQPIKGVCFRHGGALWILCRHRVPSNSDLTDHLARIKVASGEGADRRGPKTTEEEVLTRRSAILAGAAFCAAPMVRAQSGAPFRFALTPVFLDNDAAVISALRIALGEGDGARDRTGAAPDLSGDHRGACWMDRSMRPGPAAIPICSTAISCPCSACRSGAGAPLYQSYLIVAADDPATRPCRSARRRACLFGPRQQFGLSGHRVGPGPDRRRRPRRSFPVRSSPTGTAMSCVRLPGG